MVLDVLTAVLPATVPILVLALAGIAATHYRAIGNSRRIEKLEKEFDDFRKQAVQIESNFAIIMTKLEYIEKALEELKSKK